MVTDELLSQHGLTEGEYQKIVGILKREPNLTELGIFSVMWSEHCSYKSSRVHLRRLPTKGESVLQGPGKTQESLISGTGSPLPSRSNPTTTHPTSSPFRAPPPVSEASFETFSRLARARSQR